MAEKLFNAYYSVKADTIFGHCLYRLTTGEIVQVCAIYEAGQPQSFGWDDAVLVGQVRDGGLVRANNKKFDFITDNNRIETPTRENKKTRHRKTTSRN